MKACRLPQTRKIMILMISLVTLLGCNIFSEGSLLPTITAAPAASASSTATETGEEATPPHIPTTEPFVETATELPAQTPFPTIVPEPVRGCIPYPEQAFAPWGGMEIDNYYWAFCDGKFYNNVPAPIKGHFWDYTPVTGRLAYGRASLDQLGSSDLWIYDYRSGMSEQWLEGNVIAAWWSPIKDNRGVQPLLVLMGTFESDRDAHPTGDLYLMTSRNHFTFVIGQACCVEWSPEGDRIAYIKNETVYVLNPFSASPRMLSKRAYGQPIWALAQGAVIFPSWPIKIGWADGSGNFVPRISTGEEIYGSTATSMLWSPEQRRLAFRKELDLLCNTSDCPDLGDVYWVYQFSEDLQTIDQQYFWERSDGGSLAELLAWDVPGESFITVLGETISIQPSRTLVTVDGIIEYLNRTSRTFTLRVLQNNPPEMLKSISLSSRARIADSDDHTITINSISEGMKVEVIGSPVFNGNGILADRVQVVGD
jgi:hypothetical protein